MYQMQAGPVQAARQANRQASSMVQWRITRQGRCRGLLARNYDDCCNVDVLLGGNSRPGSKREGAARKHICLRHR